MRVLRAYVCLCGPIPAQTPTLYTTTVRAYITFEANTEQYPCKCLLLYDKKHTARHMRPTAAARPSCRVSASSSLRDSLSVKLYTAETSHIKTETTNSDTFVGLTPCTLAHTPQPPLSQCWAAGSRPESHLREIASCHRRLYYYSQSCFSYKPATEASHRQLAPYATPTPPPSHIERNQRLMAKVAWEDKR